MRKYAIMFNHRFDQNVENKVVLHWFLLSFNGGCINAGGFLATGRFVSHVTGFATLFGVDLTKGLIEEALGILSVPLFFLAGAFIAGLLIERPIHNGKKPHFDWVMGLCAACLFITATSESIFKFANFGEVLGFKQNYFLLGLLCLASGLQNAAITASSGRTIRTTHLTGLTTDLGLGLSRIFTFDKEQEKFKTESRANYLRIGSILFFVIGSAFGAYMFFHIGYVGFVLSGIIATYAAVHGNKAKREA